MTEISYISLETNYITIVLNELYSTVSNCLVVRTNYWKNKNNFLSSYREIQYWQKHII